MSFLPIKKSHVRLVKKGRISLHQTASKGRKYVRGKIYLKDASAIGLRYQLYEAESLHIVDKNKRHKKGKGYIVFIPE